MREDQEAEGGAHKDPIVFYVFYVQNRDVKILIAQIFVSVKILLFGGVLDKKQNVRLSCTNSVGYKNFKIIQTMWKHSLHWWYHESR